MESNNTLCGAEINTQKVGKIQGKKEDLKRFVTVNKEEKIFSYFQILNETETQQKH